MAGDKKPKSKALEKKIPSVRWKNQWDSSVVIALIAVLISSASVFISLKESKILQEQQKVLVNQQEASVWPYLDNFRSGDYPDASTLVYTVAAINKGVGPAIIDEVNYYYRDKAISIYDLGFILRSEFPNHVIFQTQKSDLSKSVLSPEDTYKITTIKISLNGNSSISLAAMVTELNENLKIQYCYCSVYGKCWFVKSETEVVQSENCAFRSDIR